MIFASNHSSKPAQVIKVIRWVRAQQHLSLWTQADCNLPDFSVHGIFQARILEWVAVSYSRVSSQSRDQTCVSCIGRWILYH